MSSKYDVIKVKVHLTDVHYYVLSRYFVSKMLMFCRVPEETAVRISLDVKKHFVSTDRTTITQRELEDYIRCSMIAAGFAREHAQLFSVVTKFHAERIPLILFIAGHRRCGKTTLAHFLATRLNCSTVINAEVLRDVSASVDNCLPSLALSGADSSCSASAMRRGVEVSSAVSAEVDKTIQEGRSIIIEGEALSFTCVRRFLEPDFQLSTGSVVLGLVMKMRSDAAERDASQAYVRSLPHLQLVFSTTCVSLFAAGDGDLAKGVGGIPTVFLARCTTVAANVRLSLFLHDIVVKRIVAELERRGRMP
ncbi:hypothetical protein LSCM1_01276 [Leishmania martiniquensis]|uniref:Zeta toxin domain-containing protein n=1 Tax=Leishmania martiniquensis TaxID=1580590 RepID=A0A836GYG7_9TRYP|nr:hypothetical protein LSCM1_01276 [Leishmania martiniquensis]